MRLVNAACDILPSLPYDDMLHNVCYAISKCYKASVPDTREGREAFIHKRMESKHMSVIEHVGFTASFVVNRGITHEMVRHRLASYTQESTRYCNYGRDRFDNSVCFVMPPQVAKMLPEGTYKGEYLPSGLRQVTMWPIKIDGDLEVCGKPFVVTDPWVCLWLRSMLQAEENYMEGVSTVVGDSNTTCNKPLMAPEFARDMLTHAVKAEIVWTANMLEWQHIFNLRAKGTTGKPHPYMEAIMLQLLTKAKERFPIFFESFHFWEELLQKD